MRGPWSVRIVRLCVLLALHRTTSSSDVNAFLDSRRIVVVTIDAIFGENVLSW